MIFAEQGNRVTQISESDIPKYVEQGYKIIDSMGTVLRDTVPTDVPNLKLAYIKHTDEIERLQEENTKLHEQIAELRKQLDELEATIKKPAKVEKPEKVEAVVSEEPKEESKPQTRKRTKKAE